MQIERQAQDWNELAQLDPHWAILTGAGKRFGRWDSDEFFATGTAEADAFMRRAAELGLPKERARALDFGCGLGRMTRALAAHFDECIGVDISEGMVRGARRGQRGRQRRLLRGQPRHRPAPLPRRRLRPRLLDDRAAARPRPGRDRGLRRRVLPCPASRRARGFQLPSHIPAIFRLQWRRRLYGALRRLGVSAEVLYRRLHLMPIAMSYIPRGRHGAHRGVPRRADGGGRHAARVRAS